MKTTDLCKRCGTPFKKWRNDKVYCTRQCRERDFRKRECTKKNPEEAAACFVRPVSLVFEEPILPNLPTPAEPGSDNKTFVFQERVRRGLSLHHPDDCTLDNLPHHVAVDRYRMPAVGGKAHHVDTLRRLAERRKRQEEGGPRG